MLTVTTPAADRNLLTIEELRAAVGVTDNSQDAALTILGNRVSSAITAACKVPAGGVAPPTMRLETLTEAFRFAYTRSHPLILSRRPVVSITSVTEAGSVVSASGYDLDPNSAIINRMSGDAFGSWAVGLTSIVYQAGWAIVPDDMKLAAAKLAATFWSEGAKDPNLKRVRVDGVGEREYFYGSTDDPAIPNEVMELLMPYRNEWIA